MSNGNMEAKVYCQKCGLNILSDSSICPNCGTKVVVIEQLTEPVSNSLPQEVAANKQNDFANSSLEKTNALSSDETFKASLEKFFINVLILLVLLFVESIIPPRYSGTISRALQIALGAIALFLFIDFSSFVAQKFKAYDIDFDPQKNPAAFWVLVSIVVVMIIAGLIYNYSQGIYS